MLNKILAQIFLRILFEAVVHFCTYLNLKYLHCIRRNNKIGLHPHGIYKIFSVKIYLYSMSFFRAHLIII